MTNLPIDESVLEDWLGHPLSEEKKQEIYETVENKDISKRDTSETVH
jgi:hypothetical protein